MKQWATQKGFTIVELLIVIVVIAILAAITIVAYNGIQNRAKASAVQSAASQAGKLAMTYAPVNNDQYPESAAAVGINNTDSIRYLYSSDNTASPRGYCVTAINGNVSAYTSSTNSAPKSGICPGHWDKTLGAAGAPINSPSLVHDNSLTKTAGGSMRIPAGETNNTVKGGPFGGSEGQVVSVSFWARVGSSWTGATSSNSKIRFGSTSGTLVNACAYNDVSTTWKFYSCSFTLTSAIPSVNITLPNDATAGYIYYDDFSLVLPQQ